MHLIYFERTHGSYLIISVFGMIQNVTEAKMFRFSVYLQQCTLKLTFEHSGVFWTGGQLLPPYRTLLQWALLTGFYMEPCSLLYIHTGLIWKHSDGRIKPIVRPVVVVTQTSHTTAQSEVKNQLLGIIGAVDGWGGTNCMWTHGS